MNNETSNSATVDLSRFNANSIDQEQFDQSDPPHLESEIDRALEKVIEAQEKYCRLSTCQPVYGMSMIVDVDGQEVTTEDILNLVTNLAMPEQAEESWWWTNFCKVIQSLLNNEDVCTASKVYTIGGSPYMAFALIRNESIIWVDMDFSVNDYSRSDIGEKLLNDYLCINIDYGFEGYGDFDDQDHSQAVESHYYVSRDAQPQYHPLRMDIDEWTSASFLPAVDAGPLVKAIEDHHPILSVLCPQFVKTVENNLANQ